MATPRGIRNNNPGNLIRTSVKWQGMATNQSDTRFIVFSEMRYGVRAMLLLLVNKFNKGQKTIRQLITSWAPPHENNTVAYVNFVATRAGVSPDSPLTMSKELLKKIAGAIVETENGKAYPMSHTDFEAGFSLLPNATLKLLRHVAVAVSPFLLAGGAYLIYKFLF